MRARRAGAYGLGAGVIAALVLGIGEAVAVAAAGFGSEAQVLWYGPLAWAAVLAPLCLAGGLVLGAFPMDERETRGWTPALAWLMTLVPMGAAVTLFRLYRDVYQEQMPPAPVLAAVAFAFLVLALLLFFVAPRVLRGAAGAIATPRVALSLLVAAVIGGVIGGRFAPVTPPSRSAAPPAPAALAEQPNLILVMVDTLRADHLSCYGGPDAVETPNLCRIAADGGTRYAGFSHASWTKPATATLLTSLVPTSHQAMSKSCGAAERDRDAGRGAPGARLRHGRRRLEHEPDRGLRLRPGLRRVPVPRARLPVPRASSRRRSWCSTRSCAASTSWRCPACASATSTRTPRS